MRHQFQGRVTFTLTLSDNATLCSAQPGEHCGTNRSADVDPSAAPPTRFRLAAVKSGWRAGLSRRAVENSAGGDANIFRRRRGSSRRRHSVNTQINAN